MSKDCKQARNMVSTAFVILLVLIAIMSLSSCATSGNCGGWGGWSASSSCPVYRQVEWLPGYTERVGEGM